MQVCDAAISEDDDSVGAGDCFRPMGNDNAGNLQCSHGSIDSTFAVGIEMAGRFVKEKYLGSLVQGTSQQQSLPLPARQRGAHITDQSAVSHRHTFNIVV